MCNLESECGYNRKIIACFFFSAGDLRTLRELCQGCQGPWHVCCFIFTRLSKPKRTPDPFTHSMNTKNEQTFVFARKTACAPGLTRWWTAYEIAALLFPVHWKASHEVNLGWEIHILSTHALTPESTWNEKRLSLVWEGNSSWSNFFHKHHMPSTCWINFLTQRRQVRRNYTSTTCSHRSWGACG